jgi:hypothetical protein
MGTLSQELADRLESGMPLVEEWQPDKTYSQIVAASAATFRPKDPAPSTEARGILENLPSVEAELAEKKRKAAEMPKQTSLFE